ncbi:potassium/proton antiporter [Phocaeicola barnesiae]|jgi:cell volume regulation protein A|uniref:potassium/proton antiporter n=1 Tax=Phocaeicola barnesiae TaxID=376804 RepID=UPI000375C72B|nr:potassium/proton antiporter [Phocaeicola barnesiae]HJG77394.1 potassium/proton antiporter [Phocaeicola barnesiae]
MIFTAENILLIGSVLIFSSILISKTGYRFGIPTLLLFLLVGMFFGSDGLGLQFNSAEDAQFIGMMALSIILFSGGMDTKYQDIKPVLTPGIILSTVGVLLTTLLTGSFIFLLSEWNRTNIELTLMASLLLAATMSSTDSASVFSLLRSQKMNLKENLRPMLELESGSNDPMAYMLTIVLIQIITSGSELSLALLGKDLLVQFLIGGSVGYAFGRFAVWLVNRIGLSNSSLYPILLLSLVFATFTITDLLKGNGYLAVYIAGVIVGNARLVYRKEINTFMNGLTWLFQIIMFLTLGLLVNPHEMLDVAVVALLIGLFMIFIARPVSVFACLLPFRHISNKARVFISWVGLRGAVPIIFATYPVIAHIEGSQQLFNTVFFITLLSLVVQGMSISSVARWLHLDLPEEKEGNEFGVELPDEIDSKLNDITLTDEMLTHGNRLKDMNIPKGTLVMLVKRGNEFIIPNGQVELQTGDKLLFISENKDNKQA